MTLQFLTKRYIPSPEPNTKPELHTMKVLSSLASMKRRHADCQIVKRKGTLYVLSLIHISEPTRPLYIS